MALHLTSDNKFKKLVVIGDRVLIRLSKPNERTDSGLYLPPGVQEREKVQQGYVIKTGPGYVIPMPVDDEPWKNQDDQVKYVPLQAREGDIAIFLLSGATEVIYEKHDPDAGKGRGYLKTLQRAEMFLRNQSGA
jgi:chaperonin GroES